MGAFNWSCVWPALQVTEGKFQNNLSSYTCQSSHSWILEIWHLSLPSSCSSAASVHSFRLNYAPRWLLQVVSGGWSPPRSPCSRRWHEKSSGVEVETHRSDLQDAGEKYWRYGQGSVLTALPLAKVRWSRSTGLFREGRDIWTLNRVFVGTLFCLSVVRIHFCCRVMIRSLLWGPLCCHVIGDLVGWFGLVFPKVAHCC